MSASETPEASQRWTVRLAWIGDPPSGPAQLHAQSGAFGHLPMHVVDETPEAGSTTPGEMLAAAYASVMGAALALRLRELDIPARELVVEATGITTGAMETRELNGVALKVRVRMHRPAESPVQSAADAALAHFRRAVGLRDDIEVSLSLDQAP